VNQKYLISFSIHSQSYLCFPFNFLVSPTWLGYAISKEILTKFHYNFLIYILVPCSLYQARSLIVPFGSSYQLSLFFKIHFYIHLFFNKIDSLILHSIPYFLIFLLGADFLNFSVFTLFVLVHHLQLSDNFQILFKLIYVFLILFGAFLII